MMEFSGMTPDQVEASARQVNAQMDELQSIRSRVNALVNEASAHWDGRDLQTFRSAWQNKHQGAMAKAIMQLDRMATVLNQQAAEQRTASEATGDGSSDSGSYVPGVPNTGVSSQHIDAQTRAGVNALEGLYQGVGSFYGSNQSPLPVIGDVMKWGKRLHDLGNSENAGEVAYHTVNIVIDEVLDNADTGGFTQRVVAKTAKSFKSLITTVVDQVTDPYNANTDYSIGGILGSIGYGITHPVEFVDSIVEGVGQNMDAIVDFLEPWAPWNWIK